LALSAQSRERAIALENHREDRTHAPRAGDPPAPMPAGESARHRNGGQHVISVNTLFWKILVTRVKRKMREGKILIPLRQLTAVNPANPPRAPLPRRRRDASVAATAVTRQA